MDTRLTQAFEQGQRDAVSWFSGPSSKMAAVRASLMKKIYAGEKLLPPSSSVAAAAAKKKGFPPTPPPGVPMSNSPAGALVDKAAFYEEGVREALSKFALAIPEGLRNQLTIPKATMLAGTGAGLWDMVHGRGVGGSLGTAAGTAGGGLLGGWGGKALASRFGINPLVGQLAGTAAGGLLGRMISKEPAPPEQQPYAQSY